MRQVLDLRGMRFGYLTAIRPTSARASDGCVIWECICKCGERKFASSSKLKAKRILSCGCEAKQAFKNSRTFVDGTCVEIVTSQKVSRNNTSGFRGVSRKRDKWQAYITFCGHTKSLGTYENLEDAVNARLKGEMEVQKQIEIMLNREDREFLPEQKVVFCNYRSA